MPTVFPLLYSVHFYLFGILAIGSALLFVTRQSPVAAALWLVNTMFCLSALYVMLDAPFVGIVQILVYAGAIMVVFVFVVMLLNLGDASPTPDFRDGRTRLGAAVLATMLAAELYMATRQQLPVPRAAVDPSANAVTPIAEALFRENLIAFEITSVLLLAAIVGAVLLARRGVKA
jgi:NADH-quinone oxidoreductase subunit J